MKTTGDYPVLSFASAKAWRTWLAKNHSTASGIWIQMYKKVSGRKSVDYAGALDEALCFGWIDGQAKGLDEISWIQKFTPRRPKSLWSQRNQQHVARLSREKRMHPAGLAAVKAAKADGRWSRAYASPSGAKVPDDLDAEAKNNAVAAAFYATLNRANTYAIAWRLATAKKPETRARRLQVIMQKLSNGEKWH